MRMRLAPHLPRCCAAETTTSKMPFVPATMSGPHAGEFEAKFAELLELAGAGAAKNEGVGERGWSKTSEKNGLTQYVPADSKAVGARSDGHVPSP